MHTLRRSSAAWPRQDQVHQDRTLCIPVQDSGGGADTSYGDREGGREGREELQSSMAPWLLRIGTEDSRGAWERWAAATVGAGLRGAREDDVAELDEPIPLLRHGQRAACIDCGLRMEVGKLLGALQPLRCEHELAGPVHVPRLPELARDELLELRLLLDAVEHGCSREAKGHVLKPWLAEGVARTGEVEQVVDDLEGKAKMVSKLLGRDDGGRLEGVGGEERGRLAREGHQRGCLAVWSGGG
jgi:hypothetical protein